MSQEQFLLQRLNDVVDKYRRESRRLKYATYVSRGILIILSTSITILLGVTYQDSSYLTWSRNGAFVLGALSTMVVTIGAVWNVESYWLKQRVLHARLRALREKCEFLRARDGQLQEEDVERFYDEYARLMGDRIEYWERKATEEDVKSLIRAQRRAADKVSGLEKEKPAQEEEKN